MVKLLWLLHGYYSRPPQYRPSQYRRPPNTAGRPFSSLKCGFCKLYNMTPNTAHFRNTTTFLPVPRSAVLRGLTVHGNYMVTMVTMVGMVTTWLLWLLLAIVTRCLLWLLPARVMCQSICLTKSRHFSASGNLKLVPRSAKL